jgi:hypothetical protein
LKILQNSRLKVKSYSAFRWTIPADRIVQEKLHKPWSNALRIKNKKKKKRKILIGLELCSRTRNTTYKLQRD